jgi:ABC-type transport system involved in multi-copper enzyme maturation permease subunit
VLSLFLRDAAVFLICAASFLAAAFAAGGLTKLFPGAYTLRSVGLSTLLVWPTLGLSLLASAAVRRTRTAVILVVGVFLLFAGLQAAGMLLGALPAEGLSLAALIARSSLQALLRVLEWLSPLGYLAHVNDAILAYSPLATAGVLAAAAGYTAMMLALAALVLHRRELGA